MMVRPSRPPGRKDALEHLEQVEQGKARAFLRFQDRMDSRKVRHREDGHAGQGQNGLRIVSP
jgi:hypothetical protein